MRLAPGCRFPASAAAGRTVARPGDTGSGSPASWRSTARQGWPSSSPIRARARLFMKGPGSRGPQREQRLAGRQPSQPPCSDWESVPGLLAKQRPVGMAIVELHPSSCAAVREGTGSYGGQREQRLAGRQPSQPPCSDFGPASASESAVQAPGLYPEEWSESERARVARPETSGLAASGRQSRRPQRNGCHSAPPSTEFGL